MRRIVKASVATVEACNGGAGTDRCGVLGTRRRLPLKRVDKASVPTVEVCSEGVGSYR